MFEVFKEAKELGSIIKVSWEIDELVALREGLAISENGWTSMDILYNMPTLQRTLLTIIDIAEVMASKYQVVVTNPPYLNKMSPELKKYVNMHYQDEKNDLFSVFIKLNTQLTASRGYAAYMTPFVWMFILSFEKLRHYIINEQTIDSLIQMEYSAFEEATVPICTFVIKNTRESIGTYIKLSDFKGGMEVQRLKTKEAILLEETGYTYYVNQNELKKIPGSPIAYWASEEMLKSFEVGTKMDQLVDAKQGLATADNNQFLRYWWEIESHKIKFDARSIEESVASRKKWFPYNKGGAFRRWYGNYDYVVNWQNDGYDIRHFNWPNGKRRSVVRNEDFYFKEALTWPLITSGGLSARFREFGSIHDVSGMSAFSTKTDNIYNALAIINSPVGDKVMKLLNPTINSQVGDFQKIPVVIDEESANEVQSMVKEAIEISKVDWDMNEFSWNFKNHPVGIYQPSMTIAFNDHQENLLDSISKLTSLEKNINLKVTQVYNLSNELANETYRYASSLLVPNKERDIKSFISYAVGVMFGRYSLDEEGLIYAGGEWDSSKYSTFIPDKDNLLIISEDEYFTDSSLDIVNRFVEFVEVVYSPETLEENLEFIAEALGGKGDSRKVIRNYFLKHFYKDHVQVYSKRPIYWQFESGKQNGFKALMYLHRYDQDTLGKVRTDYLHELQKAYDGRLELRKQQIESSDIPKEKAVWQKEIEKLEKQRKEARDYDEKLGHLALKRISLDLDDGVIVNYDKLQRDSETNTKYQILSKGPAEPKK